VTLLTNKTWSLTGLCLIFKGKKILCISGEQRNQPLTGIAECVSECTSLATVTLQVPPYLLHLLRPPPTTRVWERTTGASQMSADTICGFPADLRKQSKTERTADRRLPLHLLSVQFPIGSCRILLTMKHVSTSSCIAQQSKVFQRLPSFLVSESCYQKFRRTPWAGDWTTARFLPTQDSTNRGKSQTFIYALNGNRT
jgi:hypothetical protein